MRSGLVGPFPPGSDPASYDRVRRRVLWRLVTGLYLVGSRSGEQRNLMTCNWVTQVAIEPKLVAVAVERHALTHGLVADGKCFALSLLGREDRAVVRKFVKPAEHDAARRTLNGLAYRDAPVTGSPLIGSAVAYLDCRLERVVELGSHGLFVGEVVDAGFCDGAGSGGPKDAGSDGSGSDGSGRAVLRGEDAEPLRSEDTRMSYGG